MCVRVYVVVLDGLRLGIQRVSAAGGSVVDGGAFVGRASLLGGRDIA